MGEQLPVVAAGRRLFAAGRRLLVAGRTVMLAVAGRRELGPAEGRRREAPQSLLAGQAVLVLLGPTLGR